MFVYSISLSLDAALKRSRFAVCKQLASLMLHATCSGSPVSECRQPWGAACEGILPSPGAGLPLCTHLVWGEVGPAPVTERDPAGARGLAGSSSKSRGR